MTRLRWGSAKVEFIAVQPELQRLLTAGHSKKMAFEKLCEADRISMSYTRFCELCKGNKENQPKATPEMAPAPALESSKRSENQTASLPAQRPPLAASSNKTANAPAAADAENIRAKNGPKKAAVEKKIPFGEEKFDLDKDIYGCKED